MSRLDNHELVAEVLQVIEHRGAVGVLGLEDACDWKTPEQLRNVIGELLLITALQAISVPCGTAPPMIVYRLDTLGDRLLQLIAQLRMHGPMDAEDLRSNLGVASTAAWEQLVRAAMQLQLIETRYSGYALKGDKRRKGEQVHGRVIAQNGQSAEDALWNQVAGFGLQRGGL